LNKVAYPPLTPKALRITLARLSESEEIELVVVMFYKIYR